MTVEEKMKIVINNYFKSECDVNTSIRDAFEKGFRIGVKKSAVEPKQGEWIEMGENEDGTHNIKCSYCNMCTKSKGHANSYYTKHIMRYCNSCGARMKGVE